MTTIDEIAGILYAYTDPDSDVPFHRKDSREYEAELRAYQEQYPRLSPERRTCLREAVSWLRLIPQNAEKRILRKSIPDFYRRIWNFNGDIETTEKIIEEELDENVYLTAIIEIRRQLRFLD
jgi:hypothetical protein